MYKISCSTITRNINQLSVLRFKAPRGKQYKILGVTYAMTTIGANQIGVVDRWVGNSVSNLSTPDMFSVSNGASTIDFHDPCYGYETKYFTIGSSTGVAVLCTVTIKYELIPISVSDAIFAFFSKRKG